MEPQPVSFANFQADLRPARAVYLVSSAPETDRAGVRQAIQSASTRWAGACEPIVMVAADGSADDWQLTVARIAGVDAAVNVNVPDSLASAVAARLGLPLVPLAYIDTPGHITVFTCHPGWLGADTTVDGSNGFVIANRDGKLWEAAGAGDLTEQHRELLPYDVLAVRRPAASNYEVAQAELWRHSLIERTLASFNEYGTRPVAVPSPLVLWVTRGDDLTDCVGFWNLRAIGSVRDAQMPMVLLPEEDIEHWVGFDRTLGGALRRINEFSPDVVLVSLTLDTPALAAYAAKLGLVATTETLRRGFARPEPLMRTAPHTFTTASVQDVAAWGAFQRQYGQTVHVGVPVIEGKASVRFASPIPFTGDGFTLMTLTGPALARLPKRQSIASLVKEEATWRGDRLQLQVQARRDYWLELGIPSPAEAVHTLLQERTTRYTLSDKGAIGAGLMTGPAAAALLEPRVFETVVALRTPRADAVARELAKAQGVEVTDLDQALKDLAAQYGGRRERQFSTAVNLNITGGGDAAVRLTALERLADVGWAERGVQISCPACKLDSFLTLSEQMAGGPARCPGCMNPAEFERIKGSIAVAYRLDSRVDRATDQGVVPHLLAMSALLADDPDTYLLLGVDMWFDDPDRKQEADLFGIHAGKVVLGEVKQNGMGGQGFDDKQVRHDVELAVRAGADVYIMASPTGIPAEVETLALELCAKTGLELRVLGESELRPG